MQAQEYDIGEWLSAFFHVAECDARLSSTHISLYSVLFSQWLKNGCRNPVLVTRRKLMGPAKISIATYHKCISDLHRYGYITYQPSYHPAIGSTVDLHFQSFAKILVKEVGTE